MVLGRHVPRLEFLDVVLGNEPALTLEETFYQRLLASDPDEAAHQAEAFLKDKPLSAYYDEVALKGLALAQLDVNRGELDHARRVLDAFLASPTGLVVLDGKLIERPVVRQMERMLARAGEPGR